MFVLYCSSRLISLVGGFSIAQLQYPLLLYILGDHGKESRARGGAAYQPTYILDAVLLSDRIKTLEDMGDVISECPG